MSVVLFKHQERFLKKNPSRRILVWETGTGKTLAALLWAQKNSQFCSGEGVLIICPKGLKENWKRSIEKFFPNGVHPMTLILSKEEFKKQSETLRKYHCVIIDEMHYFSGVSSAMSKALSKYLNTPADQAVPFVLGLTATPYLSTPLNIYQLGVHMGMGGWWNYGMFMRTFFNKISMGGRLIPVLKKGDEIKEKLADLLWNIADTVKLSDCVDLPDDIMEVEYFQFTKQQTKAITELPYIEAITRWTKTHQLCGGYCKGDELMGIADQEVTSDKRDRLIDLCSEVNNPIIVCRYNAEIDHLEQMLTARGYKVFVLNGKTVDKQQLIDSAISCESAILLVNAAVSEGWQYPKADTMIFYSYDFSLKNYIQMKGRIQRIDNIKTCRYISLVVAKSIDEDVYKSVVIDKMDFHVEMYTNNYN